MAKRKPSFDLESEAQRLYRAAEARGDFTGAASVLRLLRDLTTKDAAPKVDAGLDVSLLTAGELAELDALLEAMDRFQTRVRQRLGVEPSPIAAPAPEPEPPASITPVDPEPAPAPDPDTPIEVRTIHGRRMITRRELDAAWRVE